MATKLSRYFVYPYSDVHRALVGTLACLTAFMICRFVHLSKIEAAWMVLFATLSCIATRGDTKGQQTIGIGMLGGLAAICVPCAIWLQLHMIPMVFWLVMTPIFWCLLTLPRFIPQLLVAVLILMVYIIIAISMPHAHTSILHLAASHTVPILVAMFIIIFWNLVLPVSPLPIPEVDSCNYFYKKNLRLSIAIPISYLLAGYFHLQHANWICFSVILVSQANFGATIRRSMQRLGGTILGVVVGVPVSIYVFGVFGWSHWLAFILLFALLLSAIRFYYITIFLATLLIAALYYVMQPGHAGPVAYVLYRLLDTFIGVVLAIVLEVIVFPNSALVQVRTTHRRFWQQLGEYIATASENKKTGTIQDDLQTTLEALHTAMDDMRYEPIGQFTKRFQRARALFQDYTLLADSFMQEAMYNRQVNIYAVKVQSIAQQVGKLLYSDHQTIYKALDAIIASLEMMYKDMQSKQLDVAFIKAVQCFLQTLKELQTVVATPRWKFNFSS